MPFIKEFGDKISPIRETGFIVIQLQFIAIYTEIRITSKNNSFFARIGFLPINENERDSVIEMITNLLQERGWVKE